MSLLTSAPYRIKVRVPGVARRFQTVIGLEVHARLKTSSKLFCPCPNEFGNRPNENTCPVCVGLPGALPVINEHAISLGMRAALALNMAINPASVFARKSYFYPDLPKGYQLSQYDQPLGGKGFLDITIGGITTRIGITRAHLEEDAGKLVHLGSRGIVGASGALVDLNRGGTPLLEIVSEPDLRSPVEASLYLRSLRDILVFAGVTDGNMEEGSLRCDANISLRPIGSDVLGTKVEIKNLNSFRFLELALEAETRRQAALLARGEKIVQETRTFDPATGETSSMRGKEDAHDYRYFTEPDLLPLEISPSWLERIRREMPELPAEKRARYRAAGLSDEQADTLLSDLLLSLFFDRSSQLLGTLALAGFAKWFLNSFLGELGRSAKRLEQLSPEPIAQLYQLLADGVVVPKVASELLREHLISGKDPRTLADRLEQKASLSEEEIAGQVLSVIASFPAVVADYRAGKVKVLGFLVGQTAKALGRAADPKKVSELLIKYLGKEG